MQGQGGGGRTADGHLIGEFNPNPILDLRMFEVEYPNGCIEALSTNLIAESLYAAVDDKGFDTGLLNEIVGHEKTSDAISVENGYVGQNNTPVMTTKGWKIKIKWKDGSMDWLPLSQVKNANPVELAEYAYHAGIQNEPAFCWWASHILKKKKRMINKVKSRMRKENTKFGVVIPTTVKEALELDKKNGNSYWSNAIKKEYNDEKVAFQLLEEGESVPPTFQEINCHLIFEVKFDLQCKARYVAGGHLTSAPNSITYSSVVS